jgi:site-specific DNA recombinase
LISESKGWVNWISKMEKDVKKILNSSLEQKRDFINRNVQNIKVFFDEKSKEHDITVNFRLPIVGDELIYNKKGIINETGFKDYKIKDGDKTVNFRFEKPVQIRTKLNKEVRKVLNERIIQLKEVEFLSLKNICETLNKERLLTPTGKNWDKPKLSSYYRTIKGKTPKKV